ncbi:Gfo/Idh/MocA family oxidoreductase [Billgrantia diversa]|uniref:Gfo/Idh/MocA family protein n=1 Tax=Halomonas sp. MCCC 1A13316 TaxID=2733487 RepID=UPI0018A54D2F|nr:Gfo/Idh/MocA family oxidoreductase [Halomonas sp. MCCC 1A13316]QOR38122.1 Gfo/Idh/MocA family oxidoreductase [Halomonas sp. MCCC 1A13316]
MSFINLGLVGFGKIARDQHQPALAESDEFRLVASADPHSLHESVPGYAALDDMLAAHPEIDAVAICTPTSLRYSQAHLALEQGKHVLLEKPPGATLSEVEDLALLAERQGCTLFAAWHSRFAPGVADAREWLRERQVQRVEIDWKEDVRVWHPGQAWIWEPAGMGVFDPGINALSIITEILPHAFFLRVARLWIPCNCQAPIAARLDFSDALATPIVANFDFRQSGPPTWSIHVETDCGRLSLSQGGRRLEVAGQCVLDADEREYPGLYARFAELIRSGGSEVDLAPLRHVADACLLGWRETTEAFHE